MEDNFSTEVGGDTSDGERQMKLQSLARHSPPALWPGLPGVGDPCFIRLSVFLIFYNEHVKCL